MAKIAAAQAEGLYGRLLDEVDLLGHADGTRPPKSVQTTNNPQATDLGAENGASDGNRTRALSLGITWG
ncbi:hypothetical protein Sviol_80420 [Streptomyces violascens]|uniref:Uncharacterized protein n=1 Tax=Streptomyces violascens TaxID=67381 RepID=A0ABQ3R274_9ACTN|nr:hypothetical protein Sviol_80420 [Streptomyces violascens]